MAPDCLAVASRWPADVPLVCLAGSGRHQILATALTEIDWDEARRLPLGTAGEATTGMPLSRGGLIGLLSYDQFRPAIGTCGARPRIFRVARALVHDLGTGAFAIVGDDTEHRAAHALGDAAVWRLVEAARAGLPVDVGGGSGAGVLCPAATLRAHTGDEHYLALARQALVDIRAGRYYQINLLRYFDLVQRPDRGWLIARLARFGGAYAALFDVPGLTVASFSPERFVRILPDAGGLIVEARPIKGTAARHSDPGLDRAAAAGLLTSAKDLAELHMIVDLMRNDVVRVSRAGTIRVPEAHRLLTVSNVHHLEARVTGRLAAGLTLGDFTAALCPGGSITGAPKREVTAAIRTYEERERRYFMGNAFYLDCATGALDASILIRTIVREHRENTYEFAAGSGIVVGSDPEMERREIEAKCRVLTAPS